MKISSFKAAILSFAIATAAAWSCWFTSSNFNACYIAGVNNYFSHYTEAESINAATYHNGQTVAMPITVFVKASPRFGDEDGEVAGAKEIIRAILQYKILPFGEWVTVKDINNPDWNMDFDHPVALFGRNAINLSNIPSGTEMLIRLYMTDGTYETGDLGTDITSPVPDTATLSSGGTYEGGWNAPHVMRVIISGWRPAR
jgi:hypothetical protein